MKVVCICFCGNGKGYKNGIDESALPYYRHFIDIFTIEEIKEFLKLFNDHEFIYDLDTMKADRRMRTLAQNLKTKTTNVHISKAFGLIINFPKQLLPKLSNDSAFKESLKYV